MLTDRQQQVLDYISDTVETRGYPPSVREIGEAVGLSSPSSVHAQLNSLVAAGMIRKDPSKPRAIMVTSPDSPARPRPRDDDRRTRDVPVLGRIAAGTPILAVEEVEEVMTLPTELVGDGPVFLLEVKGDSMIDAGIFDGDTVIIRNANTANPGEIVVALVDDEEATLKRFRRKGASIALEAANPAYETRIFGPDRVKVQGRLVGLIRRY